MTAAQGLADSPGVKSKTLATWIALIGGSFGLHRFYLHGFRDVCGWLYPLPSLLGLYGILRVQHLGQDDHLAWALIPVLGLAVSSAMLSALVYGLMPDDKWDARHNAGHRSTPAGWAAVFGVVLALAVGATVLISTIAFSGQRFFEYQIEEAHKISR